MEFVIGDKTIGDGHPTFIVAEMSANHGQDFEKAKAIVRAAAEAGADAVKLQTYTPDTLTINSRKKWFFVDGKDNPESWKGMTFYELYQKAYTPWEWHAPLQALARQLGLVLFSTPFDDTAVDFLEELKVPCYKIASYEATDIPLLRKAASTGKPIIMSVGFATLDEIEYSMKTLRDNGAREIVLLQCTTSYSAAPKPDETNLRTMRDLGARFETLYGFSDNMGGVEIPALAAAMGASVIEKHILVEHERGAVDDVFSLDARTFKRMVERIRAQEKIIGRVMYGPQTEAERHNRRFRRSLFIAKDVKKGEVFTAENVRSVRPADGLETRYYDDVIGRKAASDIETGTPLNWELIAKN